MFCKKKKQMFCKQTRKKSKLLRNLLPNMEVQRTLNWKNNCLTLKNNRSLKSKKVKSAKRKKKWRKSSKMSWRGCKICMIIICFDCYLWHRKTKKNQIHWRKNEEESVNLHLSFKSFLEDSSKYHVSKQWNKLNKKPIAFRDFQNS